MNCIDLVAFKYMVKYFNSSVLGPLKCCREKCFNFVCVCLQGLVDIILVICAGTHLHVVCKCLMVLQMKEGLQIVSCLQLFLEAFQNNAVSK